MKPIRLVLSKRTVLGWGADGPELSVPPCDRKAIGFPVGVVVALLEAFATPRLVEEVIREFDEYDRADVEDVIGNLRAIGALAPVPGRDDVLDTEDSLADHAEAPRGGEGPARLPPHSVLLFGPLVGAEAMGLTYMASFLHRNDVEVHIVASNPLDNSGARRELVTRALAWYKPTLVGVSLKWHHHVGRALEICHLVREADPSVEIVLGGNTATHYWRHLIAYECVDAIVMGDGEVPLLELARRAPRPQNCVIKRHGLILPARQTYTESPQGGATIHLSHLDDIYGSELDLCGGVGWFYLGKGCSHNCLYCAGGQDMQAKLFGRRMPFYREAAAIRADLAALVRYQQTLRMDFDDRSGPAVTGLLREVMSGLDLSRHGLHYYAWGLPDEELLHLLAGSLGHLFLAVDVGSFSSRQRRELARRGLAKQFPTDEEIIRLLATADRTPNTTVMLNAVAGLPFEEDGDHQEACALIRSALEHRSLIELEYLLLEWQPGSLVSEQPDRFGYVATFGSFDEYVGYYHDATDRPRLRFCDEERNRRVEDQRAEILELFGDRTVRALRKLPAGDFFSLRNVRLGMRPHGTEFETTRGRWLGDWAVEAQARSKRLRITRAAAAGMEGAGYIESPAGGERCLIYGNHSRATESAHRSYRGELVDAVLAELGTPRTVGETCESIRRRHKASTADLMDILSALSSYGFITAD